MTILEQLADHARVRVAAAKEKAGLDTLQAQCRSLERTLGPGQGKSLLTCTEHPQHRPHLPRHGLASSVPQAQPGLSPRQVWAD